LGRLNNFIHTDFVVSDLDLEILDGEDNEIAVNETAILKKLYMIHYYDIKLRAQITSMGTDTILSVRDGDSSVTKLNKNEIAKSIASVKDQEYKELQLMIATYKSTKASPRQVAGDDTSTSDTVYSTVSTDLNRTED
jgi:hypothetical protein